MQSVHLKKAASSEYYGAEADFAFFFFKLQLQLLTERSRGDWENILPYVNQSIATFDKRLNMSVYFQTVEYH